MKNHDIMLTYISANKVSKEEFLPSVAYIKDGEIKDFMFDSFLFLPSPNYLYDYGKEDGGMKALDKNGWLSYINDLQFAPGMNMDALNEAVGDAKKVLNAPDYKANIFMSLFFPVRRVKEFGNVDGKNLNFASLEDRISGVKWFLHEQLDEFNKRNYENLKISGFYWFHESIDFDVDGEMIKSITDYISSLGYLSVWAPYFKARGYTEGKKYGFDMVAMQGNYFPGNPNFPNAGPLSRLTELSEIVNELDIGVTVELSSDNEAGITGVKEYFKFGVEKSYMDTYHIYYITGTFKSMQRLCNSDDMYYRGLYDNYYKFFKKELVVDDIVIR